VQPPPATAAQLACDCSAVVEVHPTLAEGALQPFALVPPSHRQPAVVHAFSPFAAAALQAPASAAVQPLGELPAPASQVHPTPHAAPPSSPTAVHVDCSPWPVHALAFAAQDPTQLHPVAPPSGCVVQAAALTPEPVAQVGAPHEPVQVHPVAPPSENVVQPVGVTLVPLGQLGELQPL